MLHKFMIIEVNSPFLKLWSMKRADITYILQNVIPFIILFSESLESIYNDSINNIEHNQNNSKVKHPFENKLTEVLFISKWEYGEPKSLSGSNSISSKSEETV